MKKIVGRGGVTIVMVLGLSGVSGLVACSDPNPTPAETTSSSSSSSGSGSSSSSSSSGQGGGSSSSSSGGQGGAGGGAACTLSMGLIGQWSGENNAKDSTGAADGTWKGAEAYVDGKLGKAFNFDGASVVSAPFVHKMGPMTVDLWVRAGEASPPNFSAALSSTDAAADTGSVQIDSDGSGNWRLYFGFPQTFGPIDMAVFQHLAVTYENGTSTVYFNGKPGNKQAGASADPNFKLLKLGIDRNNSKYIKAAIDEVHIWDRALSDAEIAELYNNPQAKLCP